MIREIFKEITGVEMHLVFSGFAGALASITKEKDLSRLQRFITVVVGGLVSGYMTPLVSKFIDMPDEVKYSIGFVLGYTGLKSVEWIISKYETKQSINKNKE